LVQATTDHGQGIGRIDSNGVALLPEQKSALDALPRTPENLAFVERVQPAVRKYADIGVRIEDSFLVEETGLRNLSAAVPKTIEALEAFLARTRDSKGKQ
jgi:hypothetical protein